MSELINTTVIGEKEQKVAQETSVVVATKNEGFDVAEQICRLSADELAQVDNLKNQITFNSAVDMMTYGNQVTKKREVFSDAVLQKYKNKDIGTVGQTLTSLVTTLRTYKIDEDEGKLAKFFKKGKNKIETLRVKYENVNVNVDKVTGKLEGEVITLTNDINLLDKMYIKNIEAFKEHTIFIIAAKQKLEEVRSNELMALKAKAQETGLPEDAEYYRDLESKCNTFEKYIYDIELSRTLCLLSLPRLKSIQNANEVLVQKIRTTITNTIPIWKDTIVNALIGENTKKALETQNAVDDATNEMLRRMSDTARDVSIGAAKASQRGIVDVETLKYMYDNVLTTVIEVQRIEEEGRTSRMANEHELMNIEKEYSKSIITNR